MYYLSDEDELTYEYRQKQYFKMLERETRKLPKVYLMNEISHVNQVELCPYREWLNCDTTIDFGQHKGASIKHVFDFDTTYLGWCLINHDGFMVSQDEISTILKKLEVCFGWNREKLDEVEDAFNTKGEKILRRLHELDLISYDGYDDFVSDLTNED